MGTLPADLGYQNYQVSHKAMGRFSHLPRKPTPVGEDSRQFNWTVVSAVIDMLVTFIEISLRKSSKCVTHCCKTFDAEHASN